MYKMRIVNGRIIDTEKNRIYDADIVIKDGVISELIQKADEMKTDIDRDEMIIDAKGLLIGPGLADTHVHFRDPGFTYKEDIITGSEAAKKGGYTQIVLMANTNPHVDNEDTLKYVIEKGRTTGINIHTCANVTMDMKGLKMTPLSELAASGAVGFTDDGVPLTDEKLCFDAMCACAILDMPISFHEENPLLISENGINHGKASAYFGIEGSPREAEISLIERDIKLAYKCLDETGISPKIVIQHISTGEGVNLVREARRNGINIHAEATPHHFSLTEEAAIEFGSLAKMNPPLRTEADRRAIIEGIKDGTIDLIATDHAPHSEDEKNKPVTQAPSGIIGLETALSLAIKNLVMTGELTYPVLFERMSSAPCRLYKLSGGKIKVGEAADLVIFNPCEEWTVSDFKSKSSNSPFKGMKLPGVIKYTICNGKVVYSE